MRFYEGYVLGYINAVCPLDDNVSYRVVDVRDARGRRGIIRFGYEREDTIGLGSIIVIVRKIGNTWKRRIYKMKFSREEGKYIFDLPDLLRSKGIKYKLYKRYTLSGGYCMGFQQQPSGFFDPGSTVRKRSKYRNVSGCDQ